MPWLGSLRIDEMKFDYSSGDGDEFSFKGYLHDLPVTISVNKKRNPEEFNQIKQAIFTVAYQQLYPKVHVLKESLDDIKPPSAAERRIKSD